MASAPTTSKLRLPLTCDPPGEDNPSQQATWIIFGATGQMGRSLVRSALSHGDKVVAVGRLFENTVEQMVDWHPNCHGMLCDVRIRDTVDQVMKDSIKKWGQVDIIANCTGYGLIAAAEDQSEQDLTSQFENNFLGTLHILQLSLPYFRKNNISGRYIIFSTPSGALGIPGMSGFCATKYAVEGLVESMLYEVHCFGIRATLVEPSHARDDDDTEMFDAPMAAARGRKRQASPVREAPRIKRYGHFSVKQTPSRPYATSTTPAAHAKRVIQWLEARQPVSAKRVMELVWQLGHCSYPPLRLALGNHAIETFRDRLKSVTEEIEDWKFLSFPASGDATQSSKNAQEQEDEGEDEDQMSNDGQIDG